MDFRDRRVREEPEINLIPMIDLLLVIIIFLMLTTTYARFSELELTLPQAETAAAASLNNQILVGVDTQGHYAVADKKIPPENMTENLVVELQRMAEAIRINKQDPIVVINADAQASHQSVINVMEAAQKAGLLHITFATQSSH